MMPEARYTIHLGDQLAVHYPLSPEFDQQVTVQPDGFVTLTLGGEAKLVGLTLTEATALINQHATKRLKDPNAQLVLTDFQHPYFVVAGEVNSPNRYELREDLTAFQGLMIAGGTRISGKSTQVILIHDPSSPNPTVRILNLKHLTASTLSDNPRLASGDIVFVPRNRITNIQQVTNLITPFAAYAEPAATALTNK
jgi:polysaccharide export outer membrane protein